VFFSESGSEFKVVNLREGKRENESEGMKVREGKRENESEGMKVRECW
jgi:hypothetical protein